MYEVKEKLCNYLPSELYNQIKMGKDKRDIITRCNAADQINCVESQLFFCLTTQYIDVK